MKTELKALIVFAIMVLSAGPISYFFGGSSPDIDINGDNNGNGGTPNLITTPAIMTTFIDKTDSTMTYIGISAINNENFVRSRIESIKEITNYTLDLSLSARSSGYEYLIKVLLDENSDKMKIGFKLMYKLSDFFDPQFSFPPVLTGTLSFIPNMKAYIQQNKTVDLVTEPEQKATAFLLYWQNDNNPVSVQCPEIVYSELTNKLIKISGTCIDSTQTYLYGLTDLQFNDNKETHTKKMNLELDSLLEVHFKGHATANTTDAEIKEMLSEKFSDQEVRILRDTNGITVAVNNIDDESTNFAKLVLHNFANLLITDEYKIGTVTLPDTVKLDNKQYDLEIVQQTYVQVPLNTQLGTHLFEMSFYTLFSEVIGVEGNML